MKDLQEFINFAFVSEGGNRHSTGSLGSVGSLHGEVSNIFVGKTASE